MCVHSSRHDRWTGRCRRTCCYRSASVMLSYILVIVCRHEIRMFAVQLSAAVIDQKHKHATNNSQFELMNKTITQLANVGVIFKWKQIDVEHQSMRQFHSFGGYFWWWFWWRFFIWSLFAAKKCEHNCVHSALNIMRSAHGATAYDNFWLRVELMFGFDIIDDYVRRFAKSNTSLHMQLWIYYSSEIVEKCIDWTNIDVSCVCWWWWLQRW